MEGFFLNSSYDYECDESLASVFFHTVLKIRYGNHHYFVFTLGIYGKVFTPQESDF